MCLVVTIFAFCMDKMSMGTKKCTYLTFHKVNKIQVNTSYLHFSKIKKSNKIFGISGAWPSWHSKSACAPHWEQQYWNNKVIAVNSDARQESQIDIFKFVDVWSPLRVSEWWIAIQTSISAAMATIVSFPYQHLLHFETLLFSLRKHFKHACILLNVLLTTIYWDVLFLSSKVNYCNNEYPTIGQANVRHLEPFRFSFVSALF